MEVGQLCVKIAGRDAGKKCVIVEVLDKTFVTIDGETRRRKCNIFHLEPLPQTIKISKGADHAAITKEFEKLGLSPWNTKAKQASEKPKKVRKGKQKEEKPKKESKAAKESSSKKTEKPSKKDETKESKESKSSSKIEHTSATKK